MSGPAQGEQPGVPTPETDIRYSYSVFRPDGTSLTHGAFRAPAGSRCGRS